MIYIYSENPDYTLIVEPGRLDEHFGPSPRLSRTLVIIFILLLIVALAVILIARYRVTLLFALRRNTHAVSRDIAPNIPSDGKKNGSDIELEAVSLEYADSAISDSLARDLIRREEDVVTGGRCRSIVNVDTLSRSFCSGERVDINILKRKSLIPYDTAYIKVLARGVIDKPLSVYANDFSLAAVKMIALAGGKAVKVGTQRENKRAKNEESS
ncbi:MAG: uL15 family ribosomal protein [Clostridia bacterium]|nr:uL15 family ribosomal protein [Clostridia bacterium]